jgi:hypothetical protein
MKLWTLSEGEIADYIAELRSMADLPAEPNRAALDRAKELRFQLRGQTSIGPRGREYADAAYRDLEVLLHATRWKAELSLDFLRKRIKSSCARLAHYANLPSRPSA